MTCSIQDLLKNVDSVVCCPHYVGILIVYYMKVCSCTYPSSPLGYLINCLFATIHRSLDLC